jgi:hypothetical protein
VSQLPPDSPRPFTAPDGTAWVAHVISSGRTSPYLAPRVYRPIVQFTCMDQPGRPRIYAPLAGESLAALSPEDLLALWRGARIH